MCLTGSSLPCFNERGTIENIFTEGLGLSIEEVAKLTKRSLEDVNKMWNGGMDEKSLTCYIERVAWLAREARMGKQFKKKKSREVASEKG